MSATITLPSGQPTPMQAGDFTPSAQSQIVSWNMKRLAPPSPLYVSVDDVLHATSASSQLNEVVTVSGRLLRAMDGKIVPIQFTLKPPATRAVVAVDDVLTEGFLLSLSCQAAVAVTRGQTFVRLFLNPKALGKGQPAQMLMADYVTTAISSGYPNGRILAPTEGRGFITTVQVSAPAAGSDWQIFQPNNTRWRIVSGKDIFSSDAVVANRAVYIAFFQGGAEVCYATPNAYITASQIVGVTWGAFGSVHATGPQDIVDCIPPDFFLYNDGIIESQTVGIDPGDTWSAPIMMIEEWLDNV